MTATLLRWLSTSSWVQKVTPNMQILFGHISQVIMTLEIFTPDLIVSLNTLFDQDLTNISTFQKLIIWVLFHSPYLIIYNLFKIQHLFQLYQTPLFDTIAVAYHYETCIWCLLQFFIFIMTRIWLGFETPQFDILWFDQISVNNLSTN